MHGPSSASGDKGPRPPTADAAPVLGPGPAPLLLPLPPVAEAPLEPLPVTLLSPPAGEHDHAPASVRARAIDRPIVRVLRIMLHLAARAHECLATAIKVASFARNHSRFAVLATIGCEPVRYGRSFPRSALSGHHTNVRDGRIRAWSSTQCVGDATISGQMFVIELIYKAELSEIDAAMRAHMAYVKKHYAEGRFVASGRKVPRTGGIILSLGESASEVEALVKDDPFVARGLADYRVIEFNLSQRAESIDALLAKG
jgi:uncharacterized protein YciI